jgi:hypothetical protein
MMQLVAEQQRQLFDLRWPDHGFGHRKATGEIRNLFGKLIPPEPAGFRRRERRCGSSKAEGDADPAAG